MYHYPPMLSQSRLPRRFAALLASLALLSGAARPVLACDMGHAGHAGAGERIAVAAAVTENAADPHAQHHTVDGAAGTGASAAPGTPTPSPQTPSPRPSCDHAVGCAVMVLSTTQSITDTPVLAVDAAPRTAAVAVDAPTSAVEPPPPRR